MLLAFLAVGAAVAHAQFQPDNCCVKSYWTQQCTACPGYWYQTCPEPLADVDERPCGFLGCETKCYSSCFNRDEGCGCGKGTGCLPVDCVVSAFTGWSACLQGGNIAKAVGFVVDPANPCKGFQIRDRTITTPQHLHGKKCPALQETQDCVINVDCQLSAAFGLWGACSQSCGGGTQERRKTITRAKCGNGAACGALKETRACNQQECPTPDPTPSPTKKPTPLATPVPTSSPITPDPTSSPITPSPTKSPTPSPTKSCKSKWDAAVKAADTKKKCKALNGKYKKRGFKKKGSKCMHNKKTLKCIRVTAKTSEGERLCLCLPGCYPVQTKKGGKKCKGTSTGL